MEAAGEAAGRPRGGRGEVAGRPRRTSPPGICTVETDSNLPGTTRSMVTVEHRAVPRSASAGPGGAGPGGSPWVHALGCMPKG